MPEKKVFERLFDRSGYVLDFTDRTFSEFFREYQINIDADKYLVNGQSKMKRLRAFWEIESDLLVGKILNGLLEYAQVIGNLSEADLKTAKQIIARLLGEAEAKPKNELSEDEFLQQSFNKIDLSRLELDTVFQKVISQRIDEIQKSLTAKTPLATIFLCGSTLEGLLLDAGTKNPKKFNNAQSAPKDKDGKIRLLHDWTLECLINVAHELGMLSLDTKKFGHTLKDFRNYIHPRQQAVQKFNPDEHTAKITWQVLQAAIADLTGKRN
jgi:hypothetical protein